MKVTYESASEGKKPKRPFVESGKLRFKKLGRSMQIQVHERKESGNYKTWDRCATIELNSEDIAEIISKICEMRPDLVPGVAELKSALSKLNPPPPTKE